MNPNNNCAVPFIPTTHAQPKVRRRHLLNEGSFDDKKTLGPICCSDMNRSKSQKENSDLDLHQRNQHSSDESINSNQTTHSPPPKTENDDVKSSSTDQGIFDYLGASMHYNGWRASMEAFQCGMASSKNCCCCSTELIFFTNAEAVVCPACENIFGIDPSERKTIEYEVAKELASISIVPEEKVLLCELSWTVASQRIFLRKEYRGLALGITRQSLTELILEPFL